MKKRRIFSIFLSAVTMLCATAAYATNSDSQSGSTRECRGLPTQAQLAQVLRASVAPAVTNGGLDFPMWASVVDRDGFVCAVAFSGSDRGDQWPGSRVISAQKAHT